MIVLMSTALQFTLIIVIGIVFLVAVFLINRVLGPLFISKTYFKNMFERQDVSNAYKSTPEGSKWNLYIKRMDETLIEVEALKVEHVSIKSFDGLSLSGFFYPCEHAKGTFIMFHEVRSLAVKEFGSFILEYHRLGYNALVVEQRAHGGSEGLYITLGMYESKDVVSWSRFIEERNKKLPIYLHGLSMGAVAVLLSLKDTEFSHNISGAILDSPYASGFSAVANSLLLNMGGKRTYYVVNAISTRVKKNIGFPLEEIDVMNGIEDIKIPVLFIVGSLDPIAYVDTTKLYEKCGSTDKNIFIVQGANHLECYYNSSVEYIELIQSLLEENK